MEKRYNPGMKYSFPIFSNSQVPFLIFLIIACFACDNGTSNDAGPDADSDVTDDSGDDADESGDTPEDSDDDADDPDGDGGGDAEDDAETPVVHVPCEEDCENLNPLHCTYPYPSDRFLTPNEDRVTGYQLDYTRDAIPRHGGRATFELEPYQRRDGMGPTTQIMTFFPSPPDLTGTATVADIGRSLEADSPTVILDMSNGERVPHWVELDARAESPEETVVYLRLASRLEENRPYAIAFRNLNDSDGTALEPSEAFRAIRDGLMTDCASLESRREGLEEMLTALTNAGITRSELQTAWRFHTASGESLRGDMLHIRADALERLGSTGIGCHVEDVQEGYGDDGHILRRIRGTFTAPSYMDSPEPPARFVRGDDGMPTYVEDVEVPFTLLIPNSLAESNTPGPLITYGHGLLGSGEGEISSGGFREVMDELGASMMATNWVGMCHEDVDTVAGAVTNPSDFVYVTERLHQSMVNNIAMARTFSGVCSDIPEFFNGETNLVDSSEQYYVGGSQGGIFGGTLLPLSPDIDKGALIVGGVVYAFMIERSIDFDPFQVFFDVVFGDRIDQALVLPMMQHLLDTAEPAAYLGHMLEGLPGIGPKEVVAIAAVNDAQVPNLSTDQAMRMVGVPLLEGSARSPWGYDIVSPPYEGSAYINIDVGDPPVPEGNLPPDKDHGGHGAVAFTDASLDIISSFLYQGTIDFTCDAACDPD